MTYSNLVKPLQVLTNPRLSMDKCPTLRLFSLAKAFKFLKTKISPVGVVMRNVVIARLLAIVRLVSSVSFAPKRGLRGPRWSLRTALFLAYMSCILLSAVPRNKCSGFMQGGLSQSWQTCAPSGISPFQASHAARIAWIQPLGCPGIPIFPYPNGVRQPVHSQQPVDSLSFHFVERRTSNSLAFGGMDTLNLRKPFSQPG